MADAGEVLVRFDRPFEVWVYAVGHRQLLLRSVKSDTWTTRVDVLYKDVQAMMLHPQIPRLVLERASKDETREFSAALGRTEVDVYVVSREPLLLVAADGAFWCEDEGELL
ncbi:MAG TPA: hypothetical protein VGQ42_17415 [Candidatus Dormibacteraeota bacterium]|nr:hypothetical protein [Candidatus Dormibacteraeota bacterium]